MFKGILYFAIYILTVVLLIPIGIFLGGRTFGFYDKEDKSKIYENQNLIEEKDIINDIELTEIENDMKTSNLEKNNLEEYIVGVVAAEMPISFEKEALKAQAIAARTYAYKRVGDKNETIDYKKIGQAYNSIDEMKKKWGNNFDEYYKKVRDAVYETKGIVMLYNNEPIEAVFHSTSAGITEVSENIWGRSLPYIKSVDSKVDENAPNFTYTTKIDNQHFIKKIVDKFPEIDKNKIINTFQIKKRSKAGYVLEVDICGQKMTGREIRELFNLRSSNFIIKKNKENIEFTTKGYGHGAGMSQYGANFMAKDGKTYEQILLHYYKDIILEKVY